jgi:ABC-type phosphate transport system substrate-binding protein
MKSNASFPASPIVRLLGRPNWLSHVWLLFFLALSFYGTLARAQSTVVLVGSGSSVPAPLYNRWTQEYGKRNPNVQMRYLPVGTSEGIKEISHGAGDFGAGEAQLTEKERKEGSLIELPAVLIGIVPIYNLPGVHQELRLSGRGVSRDLSRRCEDVECAPDREAQSRHYTAEPLNPSGQPPCRKGFQLRLH